MTQYLLSLYQPDGVVPPREVLDKAMADLEVINAEIKDAGAWVFSGGLHPADSATVIRSGGDDGDAILTDGPYAEGKEHVGGFWIVTAPDLDAACEWGRKITRATTLPVEVRPFQDRSGG